MPLKWTLISMNLCLRFFQLRLATSVLMSAVLACTPIAIAAALPDNDARQEGVVKGESGERADG